MAEPNPADRAKVVAAVSACLKKVLTESKKPVPDPVTEATPLTGPGSGVSSLELVSLVVDLDQAIEEQCGAVIAIAYERTDEKGGNPFRTVGTLADYICELIRGTAQ